MTSSARTWRRAGGLSLIYLFLAAIAVLALTPLFWGVVTSLKVNRQIFTLPPVVIPSPVTLEHYITEFKAGVLTGFRNSVIVTVSAVVLTLAIGSLGAYGLVHMPWGARNVVTLLIIAPMMIPGLANLVPLYVIMSRLRLVNTFTVLILLEVVGELPTTVWIMRGFFETIPSEIEDAAVVDGCNRLQVLYKVVLPLSRPGLAAAGLFNFLGSWNDFLMPAVMTSSPAMRTIPLIVRAHIGDYAVDWGGLMASAMIAAVPIIVVFLYLQKWFISGLAAGAVKG